MQTDRIWERDGYLMRSARAEDAEAYYAQNFDPLDREVVRFTGCKEAFSREEVISFFLQSVDDEERYLFLILAADGRIVGESVINEIDTKRRCANFRICLFHGEGRGKGIGTWAVEATRDFAFGDLKLHRLELDVFSFNPRAREAYRKAGFKEEGILRDAVLDGEEYGDDILMAILEDEWRRIKMGSKDGREKIPENRLDVNGKEYKVIRLLGKGKGGYSYLAETPEGYVVVKQIHHEPCSYYQFGDKMEAEIRDYERLRAIGIPMPKLLDVDRKAERIVKEYIPGDTVYEQIIKNELPQSCLRQVEEMGGLLQKAKLNIDYFPTNFILQNGILYYVDYECNDYMEEWNFENWGIRYWSKTPEFMKYLEEHGGEKRDETV